MKYIKEKNYGGTTSRHIQRLVLFYGGYSLALAAGLTLCADYKSAHKLALGLVAASDDPNVPTGTLIENGILYISRSGKEYKFQFPDYEKKGIEFISAESSSLEEDFM